MDGVYNGKPYEQMDDLGGPPLFLETPKYHKTDLSGQIIYPSSSSEMRFEFHTMTLFASELWSYDNRILKGGWWFP